MSSKHFASTKALSDAYTALEDVLKSSTCDNDGCGIYHYTSTEVLDKILSKGCFRASNIYYLNDAQEYLEGINQLRAAVKCNNQMDLTIKKSLDELAAENRNSWEGLYTISFSLTSDSLQSWITYAKESGVCIELNKTIMSAKDDYSHTAALVLEQRTDLGDPVQTTCCAGLMHPISYGSVPNIEDVKIAFNEHCLRGDRPTNFTENQQEDYEEHKETLKRYLQLCASFYKTKDFNGEQEIRLSFFPLEEDYCAKKAEKREVEIKYQLQKNGVLRPYIDIYFMRLPQITIGVPITSITVGPSGNQQAVFDSVVHRLKYGCNLLWEYDLEEKKRLLKEYLSACLSYAADMGYFKSGAGRKMRICVAQTLAQRWAESTNNRYKVVCNYENKLEIELEEVCNSQKDSNYNMIVEKKTIKMSLKSRTSFLK